MAVSLEKLVKALEAIKVLQPDVLSTDLPKKKEQPPPTKKDKITNSNIIADCMCSPTMRNVGEFPKFLGIAIETFLMLCDDTESDVRMVADECLNRTVKTLLETNLGRVQVELYKEIKKNGLSRSLRAALWRFADLCHLIRPQKCRPYVVNLLPCLARICRRPEESVQETLVTAMTKICPVLMGFTNDLEVKVLLKAFLPNISSSSASARRTAATSLTLVCQFSRKPHTFFAYLLHTLLDMLVPVDEEKDVYLLMGLLLTLRHIIPHLASLHQGQGQNQHQKVKDTSPAQGQKIEAKVEVEQLVQVYEVLLHYLDHPDHNVIAASLETLQQLLKTTPAPLLDILLTQGSIHKSSIYQRDLQPGMRGRVESRAKLPSVSDDTGLEDDVDRSSEVTAGSQVTDSGVGVGSQGFGGSEASDGSKANSTKDDDESISFCGDDLDDPLSPDQSESFDPPDMVILQASMTTDDDYTNIEIGDMSDERAISQSSSMDTLSEVRASPKLDTLRKGASQDRLSVQSATDALSQELDMSETAPSITSTAGSSHREGDIGSLLRDDPPLLYCTRVICDKFLLSGYKQGVIADRQVRVSIKSLALGCTGCIVAMQPTVLLQNLHKSSPTPGELQPLSDVLQYASHGDPQLKGTTAVLVGNMIWAVLRVSHGNMTKWLRQNSNTGSLHLEELTGILTALLDDESSVTSRQALVALQCCLMPLLHSLHSELGIRIILMLLHLRDNPYWLVKVELLELLGTLDFKVVHYLECTCADLRKGTQHYMGTLSIQEHVLDDVFMSLLADEDGRVRNAAAAALVRVIPRLFYPVDHPQHDPVVAKAKEFTIDYLEPIMHDWSHSPQPLIHGLVKPYHFNVNNQTPVHMDAALSRIIATIVQNLVRSTTRHLTYGCCRALCELSERYYVTQYAAAWCCCPLTSQPGGSTGSTSRTPTTKTGRSRAFSGGSGSASVGSVSSVSSCMSALSLDELPSGSGGGPLGVVLALITASPIAFDLGAHQDVLRLAGNLFAGASYRALRSQGEVMSEETRWVYLTDRLLVPLADQLLIHVARLLNICAHIIEDQTPGPPQSKPSLPSLPNAPSLSPIKRKAKSIKEDGSVTQSNPQPQEKSAAKSSKESTKETEKDKTKSKEGLGTFHNIPHYMRLYESMKGAFSNYKISLDMNSSEKFAGMLRTALEALSQICEVAGIPELGKHAEEILTYLKSTVTMEDTASILCVQQLLKALFGTNLASQWECSHTVGTTRKPGKATRLTSNIRPGLYHCCFTTPYTQFTQCLAGATFRSTTMLDQEDSFNLIQWLKKRAEKRVPAIMKPGSKADKASVGAYIRLFEPLVIKALKQYTVTSCLQLQQQVLNLLAQLVQLRVNYCLLDSDQIFIGFVIKQFEFIEEGQIRNSDNLIPHIFNFLVLLSYERYHSKSVISMPKIIQLCDGLMASGLDPDTHVIPALQCIVHDLFVLRSVNKADAGKDVDTQREVVIAMLLKLIKHHQVLELFILVLYQCRKDSEEKWKRLSRQVTDTVLPLLAKQEMNLDSQVAMDVVHRLFEFVAPSVFRPVDILLKTLFTPPPHLSEVQSLQRWLCQVMLLLRVLINQSKEETVLSRLQALQLGVALFSDTPHKHRSRKRAEGRAAESHGVEGQGTEGRPEGGKEPIEEAAQSFSSPEETMARFLLQVIGIVSSEVCWRSCTLNCDTPTFKFLYQEMSHLLLYITHMFQSGIYRKVAMFAMQMIKHDPPPGFYSIHNISATFRTLAVLEPTLTLQWCNILILLNYENQHWWSEVLQTPQKYVLGSPSGDNSLLEALQPNNHSIHLEVVRRGGLILFCDYVCENLNDAEHVTWVIINHVNDLIHLSHEPPVQDFISAIHRNSAASGLFIQAINLRCEHLTKPSLVKKTLQCLEAIHLSQSGALLTLLIDKFLHTHHLAVSRGCDTIACRRVEMLLAENFDDSASQLPLEDLERLLQFMKSHGLTKRHPRLASLLNKHRTVLCPESKLTLSPEKTHPLAISSNNLTEITIDTLWYVSIVRDQCFSPSAVPRECAQLLQNLDYTNILSIIMAKECNLGILEECVSLGTSRTLSSARQVKEGMSAATQVGDVYPQNSPSREKALDPLLQASQITLLRHMNSLINLLPVPHQLMTYHDSGTDSTDDQYREKMEDFLTDITWFETTFQLASALLQYLVSLPLLPWQPSVPAESTMDIARFCILTLEVLHWMLEHDTYPTSSQIQTVLECFAIALQQPEIQAVIGQKEKASWACTTIRTIHQFLLSLLVLPGCRLVTLPNHDGQDDATTTGFDDFHHTVRACDQISELIHCLKTRLSPKAIAGQVPQFLVPTLRNIIIGLARLPLVNSYARTPPLVWKMGWMPSPTGEMKTSLPPLPLEYLQEKDVLREFIFRINVLGWTSRQQFEETWMSLLAVLNPLHLTETQHISAEEDIDRCQCAVLALRCITCLLVQSSLTPHSGNPNNSIWEHRPREKPLAFLHTKVGKKLVHVRGILEQELQALVKHRADTSSHHPYTQLSNQYELHKYLYVNNADREWGASQLGFGQMSIESLWSLLGMLDSNSLSQQPESGDDSNTDTNSSVETPSPQAVYPPPVKISAHSVKQRSSVQSGLDIHSCLQFLLELFKQLLSPSANPKTTLVQLQETVKAVVLLSDLFTEKEQFEWMLEVFLDVYRTHPTEDELVIQYIVVGVCKAASVTGMDAVTLEKVVKLIEMCIKSSHLPTKVSTLYGSLYLLETGMIEVTAHILPLLTDYLHRTLTSITHTTIHSQQHVMVMWAVVFYILENYHEDTGETDFQNKTIQLCITTVSAPEDVVPLPVYLVIMRGLERLLLADVLSKNDADLLVKLSVDRLCLPSPQRALAALGLMLTCMYSDGSGASMVGPYKETSLYGDHLQILYGGKQGDQWTPTQLLEQPDFSMTERVLEDPESLIVAMERVTVLFDRIRKGFPYEARVITRILPSFLADFFPPQDIMNKVIGEFLSNQQPHPQLMARVVFQVFEQLLSNNQRHLVQDWVMLSLSNFTQRSPLAMAMWSLTCFFISASTNKWLRALLPHILGRMGKTDSVDTKLFCISALDFSDQLKDPGQKRAFISTFQTVAKPETPYTQLLAVIGST